MEHWEGWGSDCRVVLLRMAFRASWCHSLKEKRMVVQSLVSRLKNKFNLSVGEIDCQDQHQMVVIGAAALAASESMAHRIAEQVESYAVSATDAELVHCHRELL